jgi:hypothetical protein
VERPEIEIPNAVMWELAREMPDYEVHGAVAGKGLDTSFQGEEVAEDRVVWRHWLGGSAMLASQRVLGLFVATYGFGGLQLSQMATVGFESRREEDRSSHRYGYDDRDAYTCHFWLNIEKDTDQGVVRQE